MKGSVTLAVFATVFSVVFCESHILSEEFINSINEKATTWTARKNFENYTTEQLKSLAGLILSNFTSTLPTVVHDDQDIPDSFDSREVWPECESIRTIRNQGGCGSCWAFAAVEVMSDRLCIFTAGAKQFVFSPEELISCCGECGSCNGGGSDRAFQYWIDHGIPSGGDEDSNLGCRPYTAINGNNPDCNQQCVGEYGKDYNSDLRHGIASFQITNTVEQMQHEIVINGPIVVGMQVYDDFVSYGSGVYQYTSGDFRGLHAVKIIGWGNDNGTPFWTIANSWGSGWGEGGFFRILRGSNHVGVEESPIAGNPNTDE